MCFLGEADTHAQGMCTLVSSGRRHTDHRLLRQEAGAGTTQPHPRARLPALLGPGSVERLWRPLLTVMLPAAHVPPRESPPGQPWALGKLSPLRYRKKKNQKGGERKELGTEGEGKRRGGEPGALLFSKPAGGRTQLCGHFTDCSSTLQNPSSDAHTMLCRPHGDTARPQEVSQALAVMPEK